LRRGKVRRLGLKKLERKIGGGLSQKVKKKNRGVGKKKEARGGGNVAANFFCLEKSPPLEKQLCRGKSQFWVDGECIAKNKQRKKNCGARENIWEKGKKKIPTYSKRPPRETAKERVAEGKIMKVQKKGKQTERLELQIRSENSGSGCNEEPGGEAFY